MSQSEIAVSYAALILADENLEPTVSSYGIALEIHLVDEQQADKLQTIIKAANVQDVESIWTTLFAKVRLASISVHVMIDPDRFYRRLRARTSKICY